MVPKPANERQTPTPNQHVQRVPRRPDNPSISGLDDAHREQHESADSERSRNGRHQPEPGGPSINQSATNDDSTEFGVLVEDAFEYAPELR